jgi:hypothetical protein
MSYDYFERLHRKEKVYDEWRMLDEALKSARSRKQKTSIWQRMRVVLGSKMIDWGHYLADPHTS